MIITKTPLADAVIIEPTIFKDPRGYFLESYRQIRYTDSGIPNFVQDNVSRSDYGVVRGLHYQSPNPQGKLISVIRGKIWDIIIDLRVGSKTFGQSFDIILSDENHYQLFVPVGFAHGFCVLSDIADCHYKCTDYYNPQASKGIIWNDPTLKIKWPIKDPVVSDKDALLPKFSDIPHDELFP